MKLDTYTYSHEVKMNMLEDEKNKIYKKMKKYKITEHTMYRLVKYIDKDKIKEKKYLFEFLFYHSMLLTYVQKKYNVVKNSQLQRKRSSDCSGCDVLLYGIEFIKTF